MISKKLLKSIKSIRAFSNQLASEIPEKGNYDVNFENQYEKLESMVLPLKSIPYQTQLELKEKNLRKRLMEVMITLQYDRLLSNEIKQHFENTENELFKYYDPPVGLKHLEAYKSYEVLNIGRDIDEKLHKVGRKLRVNPIIENDFVKNKLRIISMKHLSSIPDDFKLIETHFENFLNNYVNPDTINNWHDIYLKRSLNGKNMFIGKFERKDLQASDVENNLKNIKDYFQSGPGRECSIDSFYVGLTDLIYLQSSHIKYELMYGSEYLMDDDGMRYIPQLIHPSNMECFVKLNESILKYLKENEDGFDVLIDINSFDGRIGILANGLYRRKFVFVHQSNEVLKNAQYNFESHKIDVTKLSFSCGLNKLSNLLKCIKTEMGSDIRIAIVSQDISVDLREYQKKTLTEIVKVIRANEQVKQLIYITPHAHANETQISLYNLSCGLHPKDSIQGSPMFPINAQLVDMSPNSHRYYSVFNYKR